VGIVGGFLSEDERPSRVFDDEVAEFWRCIVVPLGSDGPEVKLGKYADWRSYRRIHPMKCVIDGVLEGLSQQNNGDTQPMVELVLRKQTAAESRKVITGTLSRWGAIVVGIAVWGKCAFVPRISIIDFIIKIEYVFVSTALYYNHGH
jgi:hypothetical protein